ncbi:MAG TPA: FIST C-terminal domain-containing protein, partial [Magnetospirillum sp.]|nr:FIST C-terminal domain-containing protein [Magnetospirillum sp.]
MISTRWLPSLAQAELDRFFAQWTGGHLIALLPDCEGAAVPVLQERCRQAGIALAGALFPALLVDDRLENRGAVLLSITGAPPPRLITGIAADVAAATRRLEAYVNANLGDDDTAALLCVFDAMVPNIGTHLDAWYLNLANRVRYLGVNAGNERFAPAPCLFDGDTFAGDGVLVQLLPGHPGGALHHGFVTPPNLITATSSDGNRIVQIDWQPALEVYSGLIRERHGIVVNRENFYTHATHFPFGIVRADGEMLVRIPVALADDDSIVCVGEIPPNSVLALLDARNDLNSIPEGLADELAECAPDCRGADLLAFYCAGRRMYMGERIHQELAEIAHRAQAPHLVGALSLGEIGGARSGG